MPHLVPHEWGVVSYFFWSSEHRKCVLKQISASAFDRGPDSADKPRVKCAKTSAEKKTAGTLAVEKHRPLMNKLKGAERGRLRRRAAELLYGREAASPGR